MGRFVTASFDRGQIPTIAFIDRVQEPIGLSMPKLVAAMRKFLRECFVPVWGTPATLVRADDFIPGAWAIVFTDDVDLADALGYHDLTPEGLPLSKVFVRATKDAGEDVSVTVCHELCEMLVDPALNLCSTGPRNLLYAYETCDAVEEETFLIDGVRMSDFVYPSWFEAFHKSGSTKFDYLGKVTRPFQLLPGGYVPVFRNGRWTELHGSVAKRGRFAKEDRRGHRSTYRGIESPMRRSAPLTVDATAQRGRAHAGPTVAGGQLDRRRTPRVTAVSRVEPAPR